MSENEEDKTDANDLVSPENTEELYGKKLDKGTEEPPAAPETINTELPEDFSGVDQEVGVNMFPSESNISPHDPAEEV